MTRLKHKQNNNSAGCHTNQYKDETNNAMSPLQHVCKTPQCNEWTTAGK